MFEFNDFEFGAGEETAHNATQKFYIPDAAECMRCGVCVSHCPTFKHFQINEETPRARLRSLDKILNQDTLPTAEELQHLSHCTQCRNCENVCPSKMQYAQLYDQAQQQLHTLQASSPVASFLQNQLLSVFTQTTRLKFLTHILKLYQNSGLQGLLRNSSLLKYLKLDLQEALIPKIHTEALNAFYLTEHEKHGSVALFTGCLSSSFDRETTEATIKVLNHLGFDVVIPQQQQCCGAVHQHTGHSQAAAELAYQNIGVFNSLAVDAVVYTASGCGLMLTEYRQLEIVDFDENEVKFFQDNLVDISDFIQQHWLDSIKLKALPKDVLLHEPCSQRNGLKNQQAIYELLKKIPQLSLIPLADNNLCCGAGGVNMISHPKVADALRSPKLKFISGSSSDILLTSNIGCGLHLAAGLRLDHQAIKVKHPVSLIAESL